MDLKEYQKVIKIEDWNCKKSKKIAHHVNKKKKFLDLEKYQKVIKRIVDTNPWGLCWLTYDVGNFIVTICSSNLASPVIHTNNGAASFPFVHPIGMFPLALYPVRHSCGSVSISVIE